MKVAVWDTYVIKKNGNALHFDIIVDDRVKDAKTIFEYGKTYLASKNEADSALNTEECQFCHIEEPTPDMIIAIQKQGYYILEMEEIPAHLPHTPTRRDMILHLRAYYSSFRFADFRSVSEANIKALLQEQGKISISDL